MIYYDRKITVECDERSWNQDLRISFSVEMDNTDKPDSCKISIYGLNDDSRSYMDDKENAFRLYAGHGAEILPMTFQGKLTGNGVVTERTGTELVTTVDLVDGGRELRDTDLNLSYNDATIEYMIRDIVQRTGLAGVSFPASDWKSFRLSGFSVIGDPAAAFDELIKDYSYQWRINNRELIITDPDGWIGNEIYSINSGSGMVGSPTKMSIKRTDKTRIPGVKFTTQLNGNLKPGKRVYLKSREFDGNYKLIKVTHTGGNWERDFYSNCEGIQL